MRQRTEGELRKEAVRRRLAGESPSEIARSLGRTRRWVSKWVIRHDPHDANWAKDAKRGPKRAPNRTVFEVEEQVLAVRKRLEENPWAQVGAPAVAWELEKLGVKHVPLLRTIERILERGGVTQRRSRTRPKPKGVPYPDLLAERPGEVHEADLVGPRYLSGGPRFYALNAVDLAPRRAGIEIVPDKSDEAVARGLTALWEQLGMPRRLKFDNGGPFIGARGLGLVVNLCLGNGVTPVFIPQGEPWRNGVVEHFNDTFDKRFFRQERFGSLTDLKDRASAFERFHNANHRYRATGRRTPNEAAHPIKPSKLMPVEELSRARPSEGHVEFVRFIRSDRRLRLMSRSFTMPDAVAYEYVTAVLDLAIPPSDGNLRVHREDELISVESVKVGLA